MDPIEMLQQKLARHPELRYESTDNSITVAPPSDEGFSVSFFATPIEYVVYFEGWHEHFETVEKALDCFSFAYSGQCRLRVVYRGSTAVRWELQSRDIDGWVSDTEVGLLLIPFWRRRRVVYLHNPNLLEPA